MSESREEVEIRKIKAEIEKINVETHWYPYIATAALFAALATLGKVLLS